MVDEYYALDMPNGKTYIGRKVEDTRFSPSMRLEDVVLTDTLVSYTDDDTKNPHGDVLDVKRGYRHIYRRCMASWRCMARLGEEQRGELANWRDDHGNLKSLVIMEWYLGEDILERKE